MRKILPRRFFQKCGEVAVCLPMSGIWELICSFLSKNTTFNFLEARQIRIERLNEKPFEEEAHDSPDEDLIAKDLQLLIDMVVANMPPQRKLIYQLSREAGLSNAEIAEKLDLSKKTVENHLNLALKELRKILLYLLILYLC